MWAHCGVGSQEYQGAKANGEDDYMCVKIKAEVRKLCSKYSLHASSNHAEPYATLSTPSA